jgi:hypothetical protein
MATWEGEEGFLYSVEWRCGVLLAAGYVGLWPRVEPALLLCLGWLYEYFHA